MTTPTDGTTVQPEAQANGQQTSAQAVASAPAGGEMVAKARLDGALLKIQELTLRIQTLTDELTKKDQEIGRMSGEQTQKVTEWEAKQGEFTKKITAYESEKSTHAEQLQKLELERLKIKLLTEAGKPQLFAVMDVIQGNDEASLKASIDKLGSFAEAISRTRESELLAGVTLISTNPKSTESPLPADDAGWQTYINGFELGSPERAKAFESWHNHIFKQ
jgi:hypothetical protein